MSECANHATRFGLTGVNSGASVLKFELVVTKLDLLQLNLPVGLAADGDVVKLAVEGVLVNTTEDSFATILLRRSETEREHGLVEETLVHHLIERRHDAVHGDTVVRKTKDTVEP